MPWQAGQAQKYVASLADATVLGLALQLSLFAVSNRKQKPQKGSGATDGDHRGCGRKQR
ncbi:hypothetical protein OZX57_00330 [Bifidobacterium sp. ESL0682]|uniref:hypothetical protein n=1 Tax=Bifidobacterium sp. ESL0682 TaxID=2983212 RepID=UPI0023F6471F|nr:hypothetical protein [Bifidobacterium sp. ESL0682]WEV42020.1 hypothetical protein OZX57_00330 [Bifidobacterium sp. ESL0682]